MESSCFNTGSVVVAPGVLNMIKGNILALNPYLNRHLKGDWGLVSDSEKSVNDESLINGGRLVSSYPLPPVCPENKLLVVTEPDRSVTNVLFFSERLNLPSFFNGYSELAERVSFSPERHCTMDSHEYTNETVKAVLDGAFGLGMTDGDSEQDNYDDFLKAVKIAYEKGWTAASENKYS